MNYEVKKAFWHRNRPVSVGEILDLDPDGARWLVGQGKIQRSEAGGLTTEDGGQAQGQPEQKRRGRGRAAAEETTVPEAPAATEGDEK
jgi:hypothetical protein